MELYEKVLEKIAVSRKPLSGEELAAQLGVSRNAVWKSVNLLRKSGYKINAAQNRGYMLAPDNVKLCAAQFNSRLNGCNAIVFDRVDSTNAILKEMAEQSAPEGLVAAALSQTAGRGRLGRSFCSPDGGIYFSILLRPEFAPELTMLATAAAAVAVCRALENNGSGHCMIKWVNDVYINGKKVCGILTEGAFDAETAGLRYAVVGIGINLTEPQGGFPPEIADRAAAVFGEKRLGSEQTARITADVVNVFMDFYRSLEKKEFMEEYRARSWLNGKTVTYSRNGVSESGTVREIDGDARLIIESGGEITALSAGEVTITCAKGGFK